MPNGRGPSKRPRRFLGRSAQTARELDTVLYSHNSRQQSASNGLRETTTIRGPLT